jgi:hypothetical protein
MEGSPLSIRYSKISVEGVPGYPYAADNPAWTAPRATASSPKSACSFTYNSFQIKTDLKSKEEFFTAKSNKSKKLKKKKGEGKRKERVSLNGFFSIFNLFDLFDFAVKFLLIISLQKPYSTGPCPPER